MFRIKHILRYRFWQILCGQYTHSNPILNKWIFEYYLQLTNDDIKMDIVYTSTQHVRSTQVCTNKYSQ
jgi:hypothetical protein